MNIYKDFTHKCLDSVNQGLENLSNPKMLTMGVLRSLSRDYCLVGLGSLLTNDTIERAKQYFYKSGRVGMIEFQAAQDKLPFGGRLNLEYTTNGINTWPAVLLSDNPQLWHDFAQVLSIHYTMPKDDLGGQLSLALKHLVLNDRIGAERWALSADAIKKKHKGLSGYSAVLIGILNNDVALVNKGLQQQLSWYKHNPEKKGMVFFECNKEATALALLAVRFGLDVDLSDRFLGRDLLLHKQAVVYEEINDIYQRLETSLNPSPNAWGIVKRKLGFQ